MAFPYALGYGDGTPYVALALPTTAVPVASQSELDTKVAALLPGQKLVLGAGAYTSLTVTGKNGTATDPIAIVAQSSGGPQFSGNSTIKDCSYLTVSGMTWPQDTAGDTLGIRGTSHHLRVIRNTIGPVSHPGSAIITEAGNYVYVGDDCHTIDIGYNELRNKARAGNGIRVYGNFTTFVGCKRVRIHHNYIHDFYPAVVNDFEPIRYGVSTMSRTDSFGVVERNVLENIRSEPELISGKMGALRITGNVAKTCSGSMVIRHGRNCILADNYAIDGAATSNTNGEGSGGFRFYDSGHLVERNYASGLIGSNFQDPLIVDSGDVDSGSTSLSSHFQVVGATVQGNVINSCPVGVTIGNNYSLAPVNITVKGNVAIAVTSGQAVTQRISPITSTLDSTNLYYTSAGSGGFVADSDGVLRKSGYGPRLTYLKAADVGPLGDTTEVDGTGVVLTGAAPTPGTDTTTGGTTGTNTGSTGGTTTTATPVRTLGVGGIPRPAAGPNVTLINSDTTSGLNISSSGTSTAPKIWDGGGHSVGRITISASWVIVQNFRVNADGQYGIYSTGKNNIIANNDIRNIHGPGDLNAITFFGDGTHIIYNTAIDFISGDPGTSHTDAIQTWDTTSKQPSSNVVIQGNKFSGPSRTTTNRVIHQCIMAEGPASTDGGGGGAGPMANWIVADNYFKGSWNQEVKFDDVDNVVVTRNTFAGDSTKICEVTSLSSGFKYYSDNIVTGSYPSGIGASVTAGAGPAGPYPPGATTATPGVTTTDPGTTAAPGTFVVNAGPDFTATAGSPIALAATESNATTLTVTSRKWEIVGAPGSGDVTTAAGKFGWGNPLSVSDEFGYSGSVNATRWSTLTGAPGGGTIDPLRVTVDGSKMVGTGLVDGRTFGLAHRFGQQYGRWECRMRTYTGSGPKTYQYFKFSPTGLRDPAVANSVQLSEFALLSGSARITGMTATATNNNSNAGEEPDKAADNNLATKWNSLNKTASELVYTFAAPVTATGYRWATANDSPDRDPVSWIVYGSINGTSWTALDTRTNYAGTTSRNTYNPDFGWGTGGGGTSAGTGQTLGVGGIAKPAAASNVELNGANRGDMNITASGTAAVPRIYDGGGFTCGRVTISADYIIVQNYNIRPNSQYAVYITGNHVTVQNCDIKNVSVSGDGDLNAITLLEGSDIKIAYNTAIDYVSGDPGASHTDFIQTWVSSSHPTPVNNVQVIGNKVTGPANPSRSNSIASIHQLIMVESSGHGGNSGGSGTPSNWLLADNEWGASWGQDVKLDCGNNFVFTRNKWVGSSDRIFALVCGSGNVVYSDNIFGSGYGQVGASVTSGSGPGTAPTSAAVGTNYNPVVVVWPDSNLGVEDGAYYISTGTPGEQTERMQMWFPRTAGSSLMREFTKAGVDWTQFHNIGLEWTAAGITGYIDGVALFTTGGGATTTNRDIQTMPSGHLAIAMGATSTSMNPATMEVDWVRVYSLTPTGTAGASLGQIGSAQSITWSAPLTLGTYVLRYTATLSDASTRSDDVNVTLQPSTPNFFFPPGIASEEAFGGTTKFFIGSTPPQLTYPGTTTFPGFSTFPGVSGTAAAPPVAQPGTFVPPGIPSEEAFGVSNQFSIGIPPLLFVPDGIASEEAFGATTAFTVGAPTAAAVGGTFVPSLWAVDKLTGQMIPLPRWSKITISRVRHNLGTISIDYPADASGFSTLLGGVQANPPKALEIRIWLGGNATGSVGGWLVAKSAENKIVPGGMWTFTGHFHEWLMTKAIVAPQPKTTSNPNGEMVFGGVTAGSILLTAVQQAQARRALPYVVCDFTSRMDSNGQPWADVVTNLRFSPKTTLMQVADKLVDLQMAEYFMTGARVLRAFNSGTRGTDRSVTTPPLVFSQTLNLREHTQRESSRDAASSVLAAGSEGFYGWGTNLTAEASLGFVAEVGVDGGNITSQPGIDAYAALQADAVAKGIAEYTSGIEFAPGDPLPLLAYDVGDIAAAVTGTDRVPSRIEQIDLSFEPGKAPYGTVAQNNLIIDKLAALYRRMNALANGDAVVGTSAATPGGVGEDRTPPAAPTGLVVESNIAYQNPGDVTVFAVVTVGWLPVTTDAPGAQLPTVQAAQAIYDRMAANLPVNEDWTWTGAPQVVVDNHTALFTQYTNEHGTDAPTWLQNYLTLHSSTGAVTDDVDHYRVQFRYLGPVGVGFGGTSEGAGLRDPSLPIDPVDTEFGWADAPGGSSVKATEFVFADVVGGRLVGVRVAAVDTSGNQSAWSTELDFTSAVDNTPPPIPSRPTVSIFFRTMNITWDGRGSQGEDLIAAAPDFLSGGGLEIHVGTAFNFTPHRPVLPDGSLDLAHSTTFVQTIYGPGTWNMPGPLTYGVAYYARFVAVDNNGNASVESECSLGVTPEQLVQIEIGPNAIGREQIIDLEVIRGKIADLAVNSEKVEELTVGKLTAGTMVAQVALAGSFYTPATPTGNRVEFDAAGIRLYRGGTIVGRWQVQDASMLNTGQSQTAITGQRIVMNPAGSNPDTIRFYPSFSNVFSSIDSVDWGNGQIAGIRIVGSANETTNLRGMVVVRDQFASLVHGRQDLSYWGSEMWIEEHFTRNKSAAVDLVIDERLTAINGPPRVAMICYDVNGLPINATGLYYKKTAFGGGEPQLYANGQDCGWIFAAGIIKSRNNPNDAWRDVMASAFTLASGQVLKRDVRDLVDDPMTTVRSVKSKQYRLHGDPDESRERMGFIAEELPYPVRVTHTSVPTDPDQPAEQVEGFDLSAALAVLWAATQKIDERLSAVENTVIHPGPPNA